MTLRRDSTSGASGTGYRIPTAQARCTAAPKPRVHPTAGAATARKSSRCCVTRQHAACRKGNPPSKFRIQAAARSCDRARHAPQIALATQHSRGSNRHATQQKHGANRYAMRRACARHNVRPHKTHTEPTRSADEATIRRKPMSTALTDPQAAAAGVGHWHGAARHAARVSPTLPAPRVRH